MQVLAVGVRGSPTPAVMVGEGVQVGITWLVIPAWLGWVGLESFGTLCMAGQPNGPHGSCGGLPAPLCALLLLPI